MRVFLIIVLSALGHTTICAQIKNDTLVAWQHYQKADSLLKEKNHNESILLFKKALPIYKKAKAWERVASCYNKISENQWRSPALEKSIINTKQAIDICNKHLIKNHPEEANAYDNLGKYYEKKGVFNDVLPNFQKALQIRKKIYPANHYTIGDSYRNIAGTYIDTQKYQEAISYCEKSLKIFDEEHQNIGNLYNDLGIIYRRLNKYDRALDYYKKSLAITIKNLGEDSIETGKRYLNIGALYSILRQLDSSQEYYEKALSIFKKHQQKYPLALAYLQTGIVLSIKGENEKAAQYSKKSLELMKEVLGEDHAHIGNAYANLGIMIKNSNPEKSLLYYTKSLEIHKKAYGENHFYVAQGYDNIGIHYTESKNDYDTALKYHNKALEIKRSIFGENHYSVANSYTYIGRMYYDKKQYPDALDYYKRSLTVCKKLDKKNHYQLANCYNYIGQTLYQQQQYTSALSYFNKAIDQNFNKNKTLRKNFNPQNYYYPDQLSETLFYKAKTLLERSKKNKTIEDLEQSTLLYQHLDSLTDYSWQSYQNYNDKIILAKQAKERFTDAIATQLEQYNTTTTISDLEKAFYYTRKSKSNILKNLLSDNNAKSFSGVSKEIISLEKSLKASHAFYKSQITAEQSKDSMDITQIQEYESKLFDVNQRQDSLMKALENKYAKYYQLKHQKNIISSKAIQQKLDKQTTVLEFFTADTITYAFTISKQDISVEKLSTPKLQENINALHKAITTVHNKDYKQLGHQLYTELIAPIKDKLVGDKLIIIPDGPLWHLNFELLLTKKSNENLKVNELPYLLRDFAISYANSATLLFNPFEQKKQTQKQNECLAFSFSDTENMEASKNIALATLRDTKGDLPGTRKEIKAIADIIDGQYYYGMDADEAAFKKNVSNYNILHLALHGEVDHKKPQNSKLFFTKSKDTIEDNVLYTHELFALDIPAELAVLSACNTGIGKIAEGEGIMSLGNAFQYAGTKSLLLSSWEVSDKTTPQLMQYFYTNLKKGMDKSKALQQAKLSYLDQGDTHRLAPFYWGSFYLVGDPAPITLETNTHWYWILGLLVLITIVFLVLQRHKEFKKRQQTI